MLLGAGRDTLEDRVDPAVGIVLHRKFGDAVKAGEALATIHARTKGIGEAMLLVERAYRIGDEPPAPRKLVYERLSSRKDPGDPNLDPPPQAGEGREGV
jgi:thymidine phosphorylase